MAIINQETLEVHTKVLVLGAKGSGKSTFMQTLFGYLEGVASEQVVPQAEGSCFYDVLAVELGEVGKYAVKANLFSVDLW
ncbi:MAG: hypothetical protein OXT67_09775, partial [Zetaproteobacteria bacterium]|nr:hypothetical protein [Zetaproteobacteria bacterium]